MFLGNNLLDRERERKGERTEKGRKSRVAANSSSKPTYTEQRERRRKEETKRSKGTDKVD